MGDAHAPRAAVRIHYHRPPARTDLFVQELIAANDERIITLMPRTPLAAPVRVDGRTVLEDGASVLWFTYPGRMHDIGIFHDAHGRRTGWYANVLTPVRPRGPLEWETTDLFLDVWLDERGARLLDEDELEAALAQGWLDGALAAAARAEAARLLEDAAAGRFPPAEVRGWTLERALGTRTGHAV
jgi:predicted RNA-binding protein associated with RNAse of E/G family